MAFPVVIIFYFVVFQIDYICSIYLFVFKSRHERKIDKLSRHRVAKE